MRFMLALAITISVCALAQEPAKKGPPPEPKNLQILTGQPRAQVIAIMRAFSSSLGVECAHCHVQGDFASDEKPTKGTARMMMLMTRDINAKFTDGKRHVGCYTCHRGSTEPPLSAPAPEGEKKSN